ncbi:MAG: hypothetical protein QM723_02450 [Myxococcaceae bacterium]
MDPERPWLRLGITGSLLSAAGILFSGPVAVALVQWLHPQPDWTTPAAWAAHYHWFQSVPYVAGIPLVAGYLLQAVALHGLAPEAERPKTLIALLLTGAFITLIVFNYLIQTTFMPALAHGYRPELDAAIFTFSFSNPVSLCWAIEMWGWGLLGVATALWESVLKRTALEHATGDLFLANGVVSVIGVIATVAAPGWVFSTAGLAGYAGWNVLVFAAAILLTFALRRRASSTPLRPLWRAHDEADSRNHPAGVGRV